jgi:hypothetical protein
MFGKNIRASLLKRAKGTWRKAPAVPDKKQSIAWENVTMESGSLQ